MKMKTSKSPKETEMTPSKKKFKQARLPFMIISEVSSSPVSSPASRKRKLSSSNDDSVTKVGKTSKEKDIVEDPVIISVDESQDAVSTEQSNNQPNPYFKIVDTAWKKKLQKSKGSKKRKSKRNGSKAVVQNSSAIMDSDTADKTDNNDCELMEVDEPSNVETIINDNIKKDNQNETEDTVHIPNIDTVVLDDSNNSSDVMEPNSPKSSHVDVLCENRDKNKENKLDESDSDEMDKSQVNNLDQSNLNCSIDLLESPDTSENKRVNKTDKQGIKSPFTPKRSARNKTKPEENNNSKGSPSSSKLNDSLSSNPSTPKQSRSSSVTKLDNSVNESTLSNNLTPKQLQKRLESAKKRDEREKEKQERDKKKQQEKEEKAKQRQEKEELRKREREEKEEAKKREKEEKEEQRKKEKEEKEKQKELEKKQKEEKDDQRRKEKEEKEEQKRKEREAREEEKRKKQEALELEKHEQELKKKKTAEAFVSFFVPKQKIDKDQPVVGTVSNNMLTNFSLKSDMRLAPIKRNSLTEERANQLEKFLKEQNVKEDDLYLTNLRSGSIKPLCCRKTWPIEDKDADDVILVEDELPQLENEGEILTCEPTIRENLRPKMLSFHENRRPPYWGTWRKKSKVVKPRKPFGQDEKHLDYEVDSDDDWEEEQEGESIDGSAAGSDDENGPDEYEVDNEVFVPHGYLSDEEATMDEDDVLSLSPETQKARLKHLEDEFELEMKKPTEKLKPRLYGPFWETSDGGKPDNCVDAIWNYFGKLAMILDDPTPLLQPSQEPNDTENKKVKKKKPITADGEQKSPKSEKKKKVKLQEKEGKTNSENKKNANNAMNNQPGINIFLAKLKSS